MPFAGCFQFQTQKQLLKLFPVLGRINGINARSNDWHARIEQGPCEVERSLTPKLNDHSVRLNAIANVQDIFDCQRLKEK